MERAASQEGAPRYDRAYTQTQWLERTCRKFLC